MFGKKKPYFLTVFEGSVSVSNKKFSLFTEYSWLDKHSHIFPVQNSVFYKTSYLFLVACLEKGASLFVLTERLRIAFELKMDIAEKFFFSLCSSEV